MPTCTNIFVARPSLTYTLQRNNTEDLKQIFPGKELRGYSPNSYSQVSVSDFFIYSFDRSAYSAAGK
jgi:hypothetical protein